MSLSTFLTDLDAARVRFRQLLAGKRITVGNGATIIDCLDLLADYWDDSAPAVPPGSLNLYMSYDKGKTIYRLGEEVNPDYTAIGGSFIDNNDQSCFYAIISGVLGKILNGVFTPLQIENNTGWSKFAGSHGIRNGKLYFLSSETCVQVGSDSGWTDIARGGLLGLREGGYLYLIEDSAALRISDESGWCLLPENNDYLVNAAGQLYCVDEYGTYLESELTGWTHCNRIYGICAGKLYYRDSSRWTQVGISDRWSFICSYSGDNSLAICDNMLYRLSSGTAVLVDASGTYTSCYGRLDPFSGGEEQITGFAIRDNHLVSVSDQENINEISKNYALLLDDYNYLYWYEVSSNDNRTATTKLTLTAPDDLDLYTESGIGVSYHGWSDDDVLTVKVKLGNTVLTTHCTGYNGVDFETDSLTHLCAGERVLVDVGNKPAGLAEAELTIQWLRGENVVKTETVRFDWKHTPQYFKRPAGEGNFSLKIGGSAVSAEVYYGGEWIDFPNGVLTSTYSGCSVRTKTATAQDAIACWSNEGADGDPFWYLT